MGTQANIEQLVQLIASQRNLEREHFKQLYQDITHRNMAAIYQTYANSLKASASELTTAERKQALMNYVLEKYAPESETADE